MLGGRRGRTRELRNHRTGEEKKESETLSRIKQNTKRLGVRTVFGTSTKKPRVDLGLAEGEGGERTKWGGTESKELPKWMHGRGWFGTFRKEGGE